MGPPPEAEVTLLTIKYSGYGQRVRIALEEKSIPYKVVEVDPFNKPQLLLESNPIHKKVPTIVHNGNAVAESLVILEYLEDRWPQQSPLMPADAFEKSKVRFWTDYIYKSFDRIGETWKSKAGSPERMAAHEEAVKVLKTLETAIAGYSSEGPFFTGEAFGYLDVALVTLETNLNVAKALGGFVVPGPEELPRVHRWIEAMNGRPSYRLVVPSIDDTLAFFAVIREKRAAAVAAAENGAAK